MSNATSVFLDFIRILAAFLVFASHCVLIWYPGFNYLTMSNLGHDAVVFFFVLSGFVIAFSTLGKGRTLKSYVLARLSRLYSVAIPALLIALILQIIGTGLNPEFYSQMVRDYDFLRYLVSTAFLQEIWTLSASPRTNPPFWSLSYEFWYYALFGVAVLIEPLRVKLALVAIILLFVGPKILLLMPIWLMGVALYAYKHLVPALKPSSAQLGFVGSLAITILLMAYLPNWPTQQGYPPLFFSGAFISDWIKGLAITATIYFFERAFFDKPISDKLLKNVRLVADRTFSLYVCHYPLIVFATAIVPFDRSSPWQVSGFILSILSVIFLISTVTESKRWLWYSGFSYIWNRLIVK
jgi:peptidoglycan/LPS O-acetylase OafA/YrhL